MKLYKSKQSSLKKTLVGLIVLAIVMVGAIAYLTFDRKASTIPVTISYVSDPQVSMATSFKKACAIFTQADATRVLGVTPLLDDRRDTDIVTASSSITSCGYTVVEPIPCAPDINCVFRSVDITVRAASPGQTQKDFAAAKMSDALTITGLGAPAFWSPTYGQLNVLKDENWVILSVGSAVASERTESAAEPIAKLIIP